MYIPIGKTAAGRSGTCIRPFNIGHNPAHASHAKPPIGMIQELSDSMPTRTDMEKNNPFLSVTHFFTVPLHLERHYVALIVQWIEQLSPKE